MVNSGGAGIDGGADFLFPQTCAALFFGGLKVGGVLGSCVCASRHSRSAPRIGPVQAHKPFV